PSGAVLNGAADVAMMANRSASIHEGPPTISRASKGNREYAVLMRPISVVFGISMRCGPALIRPWVSAVVRLIDTTSNAGRDVVVCRAAALSVVAATSAATSTA